MKIVCIFLFVCGISVAQNVFIADSNFENYLETHDADGNIVAIGHATSLGNGVTDDLVTQSKLQGVTTLNISNLGISKLDIIQAFINLQTLDCSDNDIEYLNLAYNTKLISLDCSNNELQISLDVSNKDSQFSTFDASGNSDLDCIQVDSDEVTYMNTNFSSGKGSASYSSNCTGVWVSDANFENYLETHDATGSTVTVGDVTSMGNGIAADHTIFKERINTVTTLNISSQSIADLQGIEQFTAMTTFNCASNASITQISLWGNSALESIDFSNNSLTYIGLNNCPSLLSLLGSNNNLINASTAENTNLTTLDVSNNSIANYTIDVSTNTLLETIDVSNNTSLNILDLSTQTVLVDLDVSNTGFSSLTEPIANNGTLNLGSNTSFTTLNFADCSFTDLDLSSMTSLVDLDVSSNSLTALNVKNGNNNALTSFDATSNVSLTCIEVDSKTYMDDTWPLAKDNTGSYSENCSVAAIENNKLNALIISVENNSIKVNSDLVEIFIYNFNGQKVLNSNLKGIYIVKIIDQNNNIRVEKLSI